MSGGFDVVVIGGGVAGCAAAITLAQHGINIALVEARDYPHHKVCGEVLSPGCIPLFQQLNVLPQLYALCPSMIETVNITAPNGLCWSEELPGTALGISRYALDDLLAQQVQRAGAQLITNTTVVDLKGSLDEQFTLTIRSGGKQKSLQARLVIGAYGKRSQLDRVFNRTFLRQPQPFVGLKAHFYGAPIPRRVELHTFPGGYCGMSEVEDQRVNVCLLVRQETFQKSGDILRFITWMQEQNPYLKAWLAGAQPIFDTWLSIGQIPFTAKQSIEGDVLMTGDAAGLIAPLAGDGMEMALHGGRMAALASIHFLQKDWSADELRRRYQHAWKQVFTTRLRLARVLQWMMLRPPLVKLGLGAVSSVPALGKYLIRQTRDGQMPVSFGEEL